MRIIFSILLISYLLSSCNNNSQIPEINNVPGDKEIKEALLRVNRYMVKRNHDLIKVFVRRTGWNLVPSSTGLWYPKDLNLAKSLLTDGDIIKISYKISLLNGRLVDSVSESKPVSYTLGRASLGTGIEEGLRMMPPDAKSRFIVPPHLAQGNFGDLEKIPPGAVLIVDLCLHDTAQ